VVDPSAVVERALREHAGRQSLDIARRRVARVEQHGGLEGLAAEAERVVSASDQLDRGDLRRRACIRRQPLDLETCPFGHRQGSVACCFAPAGDHELRPHLDQVRRRRQQPAEQQRGLMVLESGGHERERDATARAARRASAPRREAAPGHRPPRPCPRATRAGGCAARARERASRSRRSPPARSRAGCSGEGRVVPRRPTWCRARRRPSRRDLRRRAAPRPRSGPVPGDRRAGRATGIGRPAPSRSGSSSRSTKRPRSEA
jgi:hypothetical protein